MKLLIITRANYPSSSWGKRVRMIANGLIKNGVNVKVLVTYPWPKIESINTVEEHIEFLTKPSRKKESIFSILKQIKTLYQLHKTLENYKDYDKVLLTGDRWLDTAVVVKFCKKYKKELFVEVVDEVGRKYDNKKFSLYRSLAILNREMFNHNLKNINKLFVISSYLENKYSALMPKSIIIRSSPTITCIDEYIFNLKTYNYFELNNLIIKENELLITYAGSCERPNGILFFLNCISNLIKNKKYNNIRIFFAFNIGDFRVVHNYVSELGIEDIVTIKIDISHFYIPSIYNRSDILVLPEQGEIIANAGFPGKVGEYLISGKAIISTDFSDLSLYLKNNYNCMISKIGDYEMYINNLDLLITSKEIREKLGVKAFETGIKYFSNKEAVKVYLR